MAAATVTERLDRIRELMFAACVGAGRSESAVRLVAVSKRISLPLLVEACRAGQWDLGENRVVEAVDRQPELAALLTNAGLPADRVNWHFIGHLQSNKAGRASGRFIMQHGVDSLRLARKLSTLAVQRGGVERILLEVNISGEEQKHGLLPDETVEVIAGAAELPGLEVAGLMGMARRGAGETELHGVFGGLRRLIEQARTATGLPLPELSMGMSGDFEIAIAEGATLIRVGSALFGPRQA